MRTVLRGQVHRSDGGFVLLFCLLSMSANLATTAWASERASASSIIKVTPYFVDGKQYGYRLYPVSNPATFEEIGLEPGDLLLGVDGISMSRVDGYAIFFKRLDSAAPVVLRVLRSSGEIEIDAQLK